MPKEKKKSSQKQMEKKAKALGMASEHYPDVSFAIGCGFEEDCRKVRRALVQADERMYEAKKTLCEENRI